MRRQPNIRRTLCCDSLLPRRQGRDEAKGKGNVDPKEEAARLAREIEIKKRLIFQPFIPCVPPSRPVVDQPPSPLIRQSVADDRNHNEEDDDDYDDVHHVDTIVQSFSSSSASSSLVTENEDDCGVSESNQIKCDKGGWRRNTEVKCYDNNDDDDDDVIIVESVQQTRCEQPKKKQNLSDEATSKRKPLKSILKSNQQHCHNSPIPITDYGHEKKPERKVTIRSNSLGAGKVPQRGRKGRPPGRRTRKKSSRKEVDEKNDDKGREKGIQKRQKRNQSVNESEQGGESVKLRGRRERSRTEPVSSSNQLPQTRSRSRSAKRPQLDNEEEEEERDRDQTRTLITVNNSRDRNREDKRTEMEEEDRDLNQSSATVSRPIKSTTSSSYGSRVNSKQQNSEEYPYSWWKLEGGLGERGCGTCHNSFSDQISLKLLGNLNQVCDVRNTSNQSASSSSSSLSSSTSSLSYLSYSSSSSSSSSSSPHHQFTSNDVYKGDDRGPLRWWTLNTIDFCTLHLRRPRLFRGALHAASGEGHECRGILRPLKISPEHKDDSGKRRNPNFSSSFPFDEIIQSRNLGAGQILSWPRWLRTCGLEVANSEERKFQTLENSPFHQSEGYAVFVNFFYVEKGSVAVCAIPFDQRHHVIKSEEKVESNGTLPRYPLSIKSVDPFIQTNKSRKHLFTEFPTADRVPYCVMTSLFKGEALVIPPGMVWSIQPLDSSRVTCSAAVDPISLSSQSGSHSVSPAAVAAYSELITSSRIAPQMQSYIKNHVQHAIQRMQSIFVCTSLHSSESSLHLEVIAVNANSDAPPSRKLIHSIPLTGISAPKCNRQIVPCLTFDEFGKLYVAIQEGKRVDAERKEGRREDSVIVYEFDFPEQVKKLREIRLEQVNQIGTMKYWRGWLFCTVDDESFPAIIRVHVQSGKILQWVPTDRQGITPR